MRCDNLYCVIISGSEITFTITDGPSGVKVPKSEIGIGTEISLKMNNKNGICIKINKKNPFKNVGWFQKKLQSP